LNVPVTPEQFDTMNPFNASFLRMGLKHESSWQKVATPQGGGWVSGSNTQLYLQAGKVKMLSGPTSTVVPRGRDCYFLVEAPDVVQMALWNNGQWFAMYKNGTRFEGMIRPETGEMKLCLQRPLDPNFQAVVTYKVEK
jgi:hypothetical protein